VAGELVVLVVESLGSEGDGVGRRADGLVVFVPGTIPGDRVRVELGPSKRGVQRGLLKEVLEASADRTKGRCSVDPCGGCPLRNSVTEGQSRFKRERILQTLRRIGKIDATDVLLKNVVQDGDGWRYRHRVRLHATYEESEWRIGYYGRQSHDIVPVQGCVVLWRPLEQVAMTLARELRNLPPRARLETVEIAYSRRDDRATARLIGQGEMREYRRSLSWFEASGLNGVEVESGGERWRYGKLDLRYDHGRAEGYDICFEPGMFTQANPAMNDRLIDTLVRLVRPQQHPRILELHAGIGNFTVPLGLAGAKVTAIEKNRRAAIMGRRNIRTVSIAAEIAESTDAEAVVDLEPYDVVLLDPPRAGARAAAEALAERGPERVVYVSCDVATFARDAQILTAGGYQLESIEAFDMFPQTAHIETVATFNR